MTSPQVSNCQRASEARLTYTPAVREKLLGRDIAPQGNLAPELVPVVWENRRHGAHWVQEAGLADGPGVVVQPGRDFRGGFLEIDGGNLGLEPRTGADSACRDEPGHWHPRPARGSAPEREGSKEHAAVCCWLLLVAVGCRCWLVAERCRVPNEADLRLFGRSRVNSTNKAHPSAVLETRSRRSEAPLIATRPRTGLTIALCCPLGKGQQTQ